MIKILNLCPERLIFNNLTFLLPDNFLLFYSDQPSNNGIIKSIV